MSEKTKSTKKMRASAARKSPVKPRATAPTARQSLARRAKAAIAAWVVESKGTAVLNVCHVQPRGYVVARLAESCLLVATPWLESEPQVREAHKRFGFEWVREFDRSLATGDWCSLAYVSTEGCGEQVAIHAVE